MEQEIVKLNYYLKIAEFEQVCRHIEKIAQDYKVKFSVVNANKFTEIEMKKAQTDKVRFVNMQYFEKAAACRDLEFECKKYIDIINQHCSIDPVFINDEGDITLLYFNESDITLKIRAFIRDLPDNES